MSDSMAPTRETGRSGSGPPRALIHKKILDAAAAAPTATLDELASEVSGASADLVERVLDEYGDPGSDEAAGDPDAQSVDDGDGAAGNGGDGGEAKPGGTDQEDSNSTEDRPTEGSMSTEQTDHVPDPAEFDEREREILSAVADRPGATQAEIADELGVSRATVSRRASGIEGFEWDDRAAFVDEALDGTPAPEANDEGDEGDARDDAGEEGRDADQSAAETGGSADPATDGEGAPPAGTADDGDLADRVDALEDRLDELDARSDDGPADPELVHKVVDACMRSDRISEDEEVRVLSALMNADGTE